MSNPNVNRLSINQFWYNHWYSDKFFQHKLSQDKNFKQLLSYYIKSGLNYSKNPLYHHYWYKKNLSQQYLNSYMVKFFRRYFYNNSFLGIEHSYFLRTLAAENFPMRIWLFRFNNWLIISFQAFLPIKDVSLSKKNFSNLPSSTGSFTYNRTNFKINRLKFFITFVKYSISKNNNLYFF